MCKQTINAADQFLTPEIRAFLTIAGISVDPSLCDSVANFIARDGLDGTYDWRDALNYTYNALRTAQPYFSVSER